jgi:hypothetical protein
MRKRNSPTKSRRDLDGNPVTNRILCSISDEEFRKLRPKLEFLELPHHRSLHEPAKNMNAAYFLNNGLASLIVATEQGKSVEVGIVGVRGSREWHLQQASIGQPRTFSCRLQAAASG